MDNQNNQPESIFGIVPIALYEYPVSTADLKVYGALSSIIYSGIITNVAVLTIAQRAHIINHRVVRRALKRLADMGVITRTFKGSRATEYTLVPLQDTKEVTSTRTTEYIGQPSTQDSGVHSTRTTEYIGEDSGVHSTRTTEYNIKESKEISKESKESTGTFSNKTFSLPPEVPASPVHYKSLEQENKEKHDERRKNAMKIREHTMIANRKNECPF